MEINQEQNNWNDTEVEMIATGESNQGNNNEPTMQEMASLLQDVRDELIKTRVVVQELRDQREAFACTLERQWGTHQAQQVGTKLGSKGKIAEPVGLNTRVGGNTSKVGIKRKKKAWCVTCRSEHAGVCTINTLRCDRCAGMGHMLKDCTGEARCYKCKQTGHQVADCPKLKNARRKNARPRTTIYAFDRNLEEAREKC